VPLVLAPLVPLGLEDLSASDDLLSEEDDELLMLPELSLEVALVAAITGNDSTQVNPAMANA
jgi:hypothetical protein